MLLTAASFSEYQNAIGGLEKMKTIICRHDGQGHFEVIGTDGEPMRLILLEEDHMDGANIEVNGGTWIGWEFEVKSKPDIVTKALSTYSPMKD